MALRRLAPNIYEDTRGIRAIAIVGRGLRREKRFPPGTSLRIVSAWLEAERTRLRQQKGRLVRLRGTFEGDVLERLRQMPEGRARDNARWDLGAWIAALGGTRRRARLTVDDLRTVVNGWIEAGVPASTINHRRRALAQLYEALDGPDAPNPARQLRRVKEVLPEPTAYPMDVLTAIIDGMDARRGHLRKGESDVGATNKSQARLRMLLWTGMPPISLQRLSPRRVAFELESGRLWYPPRAKGQGAAAALLPLFPEGVESVRRWLRARAWGTFSESSLQKALRRAAQAYAMREAAAGRASPVPHETVTTYDLRHSFLTWLYEETGDPYLVRMFGQHASLETTARYTRKGVPTRAAEAVARIAAAREA